MKRTKEIIFVQEVIKAFHHAENRMIIISKEITIIKKNMLKEVNNGSNKLIHEKLSSLEREHRQAVIFCRLVDDILKNIELDTAIDETTYGIFHYYFFEKPNQDLAANAFNLSRTPGRKRIVLCSELFVYYWKSMNNIQPLGKDSTPTPMTAVK